MIFKIFLKIFEKDEINVNLRLKDVHCAILQYEERDIHERADEYCRTISADKYHYVKPGDIGYDIQESSNLNGFHLNCPLPKKKKRRNYLTDSCYVTACDFHDPYDNTKMLPTGNS